MRTYTDGVKGLNWRDTTGGDAVAPEVGKKVFSRALLGPTGGGCIQSHLAVVSHGGQSAQPYSSLVLCFWAGSPGPSVSGHALDRGAGVLTSYL